MNIRRSQKKTKREIQRRKRKYLISIVLFILLFVCFIWFVNQDKFKISHIVISGNKTILEQDILDIVLTDITKKTLFIFPRDNIFLLNISKLKHHIENYFPKIYNTQINIRKGTELFIQVEERKPHSLWCKDNEYKSQFNEECFFADQKGYIYTKAPYFSSGVFEKIYTTSELLKIGEKIMDLDRFTDFFEFIDYISNHFGITVDYIFLDAKNETKIYISSFQNKILNGNPYIVFHTDEDYTVVARNLDLMINHELFEKDFSQNSNRLKFIDLRIPDQIRYKFFTDEEYQLLLEQKNKKENKMVYEES